MGERGAAVVAERAVVASRSVREARCLAAIATAVVILAASTLPVAAQDRCRVLCAPELKIEPTFTIENLVQAPTIETLADGVVVERFREPRERVFELIFALDVPTVLPWLGLTFEAIFKPFGSIDANPFTGASAVDIGRTGFRDNGVEIESELNFILFDVEQTGGWISSHVDVVDQFSPAHQPNAGSVFTHKLDFEWDTAFHVFNRLPEQNWLRNVEVEVSLDYLATGLPKAGDIFGSDRFVDRASPWSLSFVLVMPLAPLVP